TALRTPGRYRVRVSAPAVTSPWLRVDADPDQSLAALLPTFFQAQRDGAAALPQVLGRRPAHLRDRDAAVHAPARYDGGSLAADLTGTGARVDVEGGWFDAGDYLKFTHTAAYATVALLLARRDRGLDAASPVGREADHGLAWLTKMFDADTGVLYAQVGLGDGGAGRVGDHDRWRLPEADDGAARDPADPAHYLTARPVFPANPPGEPVSGNLAGRVAAAFALGAQLAPPPKARRLLERAAALYDAADDAAGVTTYPASYYTETSADDDLALAATQLARAARRLADRRQTTWRADAVRRAAAHAARGGDVPGVADVGALAVTDLLPLLGGGAAADTRAALLRHLRATLDAAAARAAAEPFGAAVDLTQFDAAPRALGVAALARLYARASGDDRTYAGLAALQRQWVLGANPWGTAFLVGAGGSFPRCPHHQVANLTGGQLTGAVVNGPNAAGLLDDLPMPAGARDCAGPDLSAYDGRGSAFRDATAAWPTAEPALDFAATALLAFALP
ncbi:MAG TPA: glycoside hydrolase family 9 protein, partial [Pilimelia sp.]|nr:glycoside hydrolase family 9 protein [Pilimelia sp.]